MLVQWAGPPGNNSHSSNSAGGICRWAVCRMDSSSMARALSPSRSCLSLGSSDMSSGELSTDSDCSSQHGEVFCNTGKAWVQKPRQSSGYRRSQRVRLRDREEAAARQLDTIRQRCSLLRQRLATSAVRRQELNTQVEEASAMWAATTRSNQELAAGIAVLRAQLEARAAAVAEHAPGVRYSQPPEAVQGFQPSPFEQPASMPQEAAGMEAN